MVGAARRRSHELQIADCVTGRINYHLQHGECELQAFQLLCMSQKLTVVQLMKYLDLDQKGYSMAEYIWIDGKNGVRSKTKVRALYSFSSLLVSSCRIPILVLNSRAVSIMLKSACIARSTTPTLAVGFYALLFSSITSYRGSS